MKFCVKCGNEMRGKEIDDIYIWKCLHCNTEKTSDKVEHEVQYLIKENEELKSRITVIENYLESL